jgi:L-aspartate oxidase
VVVGAGVAGLCVALAAAPRRVLLFSRAPGDGATSLAQGGIAAALAPDDHPDAHAADTLAAGAAHNDAALVQRLVNDAPAAVRWLAALGVPFDRDARGWQLGREGGHDRARIVHAGGDASGRELLAALVRAAAAAPHVERREGWTLRALRRQGGRIAGVRLVRSGGRGELEIETPDVVLATGGIGALFAATTNPPGADGSGLALALATGAAARDLEFVQFHPTALAVPGVWPLPLVTEALRGAGAVLRDDAGVRLMTGVHPLADLAPRDLVARRIWRGQRDGGRVWLDATSLDAAAWRQFPTVRALCGAHGIDPATMPIPVTPAAHFHMGGIAVRVRAQLAARPARRRRSRRQRRARRQPAGQQLAARGRGVRAAARRLAARRGRAVCEAVAVDRPGRRCRRAGAAAPARCAVAGPGTGPRRRDDAENAGAARRRRRPARKLAGRAGAPTPARRVRAPRQPGRASSR